ncbi:MAG TPA: hypothetical protein VG960_02045 [Caulobacteraceae bacterium]|nr:hypothetical protein [Caulobacteraceae bacterium]
MSAAAPDLARALLERQLWVLGQLAEGGLEIARAIERRATSDESEDAVLEAAPMAYARVARAVRMTILLQSKLIADLQALEVKGAQAANLAAMSQDIARPDLEDEQKKRIQRIVWRVADANGRDKLEADRMYRETGERLEQDELYGDVLSRPLSELIAQICNDMGLEPNWPDLAEQAWAQAEINTGVAAAPLAAVMGKGLDTRAPPSATGVAQFTPHAASP